MPSAPTTSSSSVFRCTIITSNTTVCRPRTCSSGPRIDLGWGWNASWAVFMLPNLEQAPLYNAYNFSVNADSGINTTVTYSAIPTFSCPSDNQKVRPNHAVGADELRRQPWWPGRHPHVVRHHRRVPHVFGPGRQGQRLVPRPVLVGCRQQPRASSDLKASPTARPTPASSARNCWAGRQETTVPL